MLEWTAVLGVRERSCRFRHDTHHASGIFTQSGPCEPPAREAGQNPKMKFGPESDPFPFVCLLGGMAREDSRITYLPYRNVQFFGDDF